jgi:hypothetical protein
MHSAPMSESDGKFRDSMKPAIMGDGKPWPCPRCKAAGRVTYKVWDSSCGGYEDIKYHCGACGKTWWVEGADS